MTCLHYYQQGKGEPTVIFVHGLFGSGRNWHTYLRYVQRETGLTCCAPDLRGQGSSDSFFNKNGLAQLVEDLHKFIQEITSSKVTLIGHSLGGKISILLAAEFPELIKKVMIVDTALSPVTDDVVSIWKWQKQLPMPISERKEARAYFDKLTSDQRLRNFLLTNLVKIDDSYKWRIDLDGLYSVVIDLIEVDLSEPWKRISAPILLVRGADSAHLTQKDVQEMRNSKVIEYAEIANAGHWVHADNPEVFKKHLLSFLSITSK